MDPHCTCALTAERQVALEGRLRGSLRKTHPYEADLGKRQEIEIWQQQFRTS
jgi:hypothetical protein